MFDSRPSSTQRRAVSSASKLRLRHDEKRIDMAIGATTEMLQSRFHADHCDHVLFLQNAVEQMSQALASDRFFWR